MPLFGRGKPERMRLVLRSGDSAALEPAVAEAVRKMGLDPSRYTLSPMAEGETAPFADLPTGGRLIHRFHFDAFGPALTAVERFVDERRSARVSKVADGWVVAFDDADDPDVGDDVEHARLAREVIATGVRDEGFYRMNVERRDLTF